MEQQFLAMKDLGVKVLSMDYIVFTGRAWDDRREWHMQLRFTSVCAVTNDNIKHCLISDIC